MTENSKESKASKKNTALLALEAEYITLKTQAQSGKKEHQLQLAENYKQMAEIHFRQSNYHASGKLFSQALAIFARLKDNIGLITCQNAQASICLAKGELAAAQSKLEGLLKLFKKNPNPELEHIVLNNMGIVHEKKGDLPQAVLFYHKSLIIKYELDNPLLPTYTLHNMANIYQQIEDYERALEYDSMAYKIIENGTDLNAQATILNSIAFTVSMQGLHNQAQDTFLEAKNIAEKGNNLAQIAQSQAGLGKIEFKRRNFKQAKQLIEESLASYRKLEEQEYIVRCLIDLAKINHTINLNEGLSQIQEASRICKINGFRSLLAEVYEQSAQLKATKKDYKKAFYYQKLYIELFKETNKTNILNQLEVNQLSIELKHSKIKSKDLKQQTTQLKYESLHDHLTGAGNRRQLDEQLEKNWSLQSTQDHPNHLAMLDIDDFKTINDTYSHAVGDEVLQVISSIISSEISENDKLYRYGGEEFVILLKNTESTKAHNTLNAIRQSIESYDWHKINDHLKVTATLGMVNNTEQQTIEKALNLADERMYKGKSHGKNQVVFS
ncbi:MAG: diguanylate cyclase [Marinicellaceae bacterium]